MSRLFGGAATTVLLMLLASGPASAQKLSPEADFALWCLAAIDHMDEKGLLPSELDDARSDAIYQWHEGVIAQEISDADLPDLRKSYVDEVTMQLDDWAINRDSAALRLNLDDCFVPP